MTPDGTSPVRVGDPFLVYTEDGAGFGCVLAIDAPKPGRAIVQLQSLALGHVQMGALPVLGQQLRDHAEEVL